MNSLSLLHAAGRGRFVTSMLRWLLAATCALGAVAPISAAGAGATIDAIVVKFNAGAVPSTDAAVEQAVQTATGLALTTSGRTRDGAFRLVFPTPLDLDAARAAINRVRLEAAVLYANVAPGAPLPDTTGRPTDRLVVKYRDATRTAIAAAGIALAPNDVDRLTIVAGRPVAWLRGAPDGANVLQMMQRLPIAEVEAIAARIALESDVDYAQPDYIRTAQLVPTDPCYASASVAACAGGYQWDLFDPVGGINVQAAWDISTGAAGINVAVIDTGALFNHPDLAGRFIGGYDMISDCAVGNDAQPGPCTWSSQTQSPDLASRDGDGADAGDWITAAENAPTPTQLQSPPYDWFQGCGADNSSFHGTHVAGTIGATPNNGIGIAGINWVSKIVPLRVLGKCGGYNSDIAAAMVWAAGGNVAGAPVNPNPARVLNLSLGGGGSCDAASQNAINTALGLGAVVVVAAGNNNSNAAGFSPASCSGVITVAATNKAGRRSWYSNYGAVVEIAAPGGSADGSDTDILSTLNSGATSPIPNGYNYARYAGTSMATPHVAGVVSLMLSVNPALTPALVLQRLQTTARVFPTPGPACSPVPQGSACNCTTALCGSGILDAAAAVAAAQGTGTALASSANPATSGTTVTFTATVTGNAPTGTVNFKDGGNSIANCAAVALTGAGDVRTAQCQTNGLTAGTHSIVATYGGDGNNATSSSPALSQVINPANGTTLTSATNPAAAGANVALTATVTANNPTGSVNFKDGATSITGCAAVPLTGSGNTKTALCNTTSLAVGTHSLTAVYGGSRSTPGSTSAPLTQVITGGGGPAPTTTTLVSAPNPSTVGQNVLFTATIVGTAPTGSVNFRDGATSITGCAAVAVTGSGNTRTAVCNTTALTQGAHSITANYGGDAGNAASASAPLAQTVNGAAPVPTTTLLVSAPNPSTAGSMVTFTATVNGVNPTGTVNFRDGAVSIAGCTAAPVAGSGNSRTAVCGTSSLTQGAHSITANYGGDGANAASTSAPLSQVVNPASCIPGRTC
jgi:serine protease